MARGVVADNCDERTTSLLAISASNLGEDQVLQLELPFRLADDGRRPGTRRGIARLRADRAIDAIRERFGREAVKYASAAPGASRSLTSCAVLRPRPADVGGRGLHLQPGVRLLME